MLQNSNNYRSAMLGCIGKDENGAKMENLLKKLNIVPLLEIHPTEKTSRCGVGIVEKERCLLAEILASKHLSLDYVKSIQV